MNEWMNEWLNEWRVELIKWMIIRSDLDPCCFNLYFYMVRTGLDSTFHILVYLRLNMIINNTPKWLTKILESFLSVDMMLLHHSHCGALHTGQLWSPLFSQSSIHLRWNKCLQFRPTTFSSWKASKQIAQFYVLSCAMNDYVSIERSSWFSCRFAGFCLPATIRAINALFLARSSSVYPRLFVQYSLPNFTQKTKHSMTSMMI